MCQIPLQTVLQAHRHNAWWTGIQEIREFIALQGIWSDIFLWWLQWQRLLPLWTRIFSNALNVKESYKLELLNESSDIKGAVFLCKKC